MLLYPPMNELLSRVPSRYMLVNIVANRARKISSEAEQTGTSLTEKPVTMAIQEIANDKLTIDLSKDIEETVVESNEIAEQDC